MSNFTFTYIVFLASFLFLFTLHHFRTELRLYTPVSGWSILNSHFSIQIIVISPNKYFAYIIIMKVSPVAGQVILIANTTNVLRNSVDA